MNQEHQEARGEKKALQIQIYFITFTPTFYKKKNMSIKVHSPVTVVFNCLYSSHTLKQKLYPL